MTDQTIPNPETNGKTEPDMTNDQLLSVLVTVADRLIPAPAPKPETVTANEIKAVMFIDPELSDIAGAIHNLEKVAIGANNILSARAKRLIRTAPARNSAAWQHVLLSGFKDLEAMSEDMIIPARRFYNHARHLTQLLVLAADGNPFEDE